MNDIPMLKNSPVRQALANAFELYRFRPTKENARELLRAAKNAYFARESVSGMIFASYHVTAERGHARLPWLAKWASRKLMPIEKISAGAQNDYWQARWMLTKEKAALIEIHRRAFHWEYPPSNLPGPPCAAARNLEDAVACESAGWMLRSYRETDPEYDAAMREVENECRICKSDPAVRA